ncbi:ArsR/SmtB family transcription factor [Halalkalicoccus jeotgali]|uniref:ArsR family transcriptional regulator n=1 Tax=Halalkalicoccus jeotgali (strain DSM 18796 / CECT 7217 / JCM 14584 / KCTC 4019 / B3) TaxID=795797 RepID=D8JAF3_HALJB|nr:metalloregulator ArsR/SmtB family transcription factor [Halalkalicoccus jeotgali]ADJ14675.1 conditioned medium-induced protein 2 [Halalkalicoccus jeotgali B3]ELY39573.1 ArsR family transcriptional regulator [Halalkalicoccus jeotgali B3]
MDSAALLDLLGNENRRRILRLLSQKPCYVTEISEYLGVSPKAVIDHLRKLEEAGLVESRTDDRRRKYFHIARNLRLEVSVSPYGFASKSAYPASSSLDMTSSCSHLSINVTATDGGDVCDLAGELRTLEELEDELSLAQRWVQGRIAEAHERISEAIGDAENSRLYAAVLSALDDGATDTETIAREAELPPPVAEDALSVLADHGVVARTETGWALD